MYKTYIILAILIILIIIFILINNKQKTQNNMFNINNLKNSNKKRTIPLNLFQTWATLDLPPKMKENVELLKNQNPEFKYYLYDDKMCRDFIEQNFDKSVLYTFDKLTPGAYKADLFRYCVLYIYGGVYLDIKYHCINDFKLIYLTDKEYFARDRFNKKYGIFQALMICYPYNNILLKCINNIINNIKINFYGELDLEPTGPLLMSNYFSTYEIENLELSISPINNDIYYKTTAILKSYKEYREEQKLFSKVSHYSKLYNELLIYNYFNLISTNTTNYKINSNSCNIIKHPNKDNYYIVNIENNINKIMYYQFEIDNNFNKISNEISIINNNIYNIKLFNNNNIIYYIGNLLDNKNNKKGISCNIYDIYNNIFVPNIIIPYNNDNNDNNNDNDNKILSLFNYQGGLSLICNWFPINIYKLDINNISLKQPVYKYNVPTHFSDVSNSSSGYTFNNEIWFILQKNQTRTITKEQILNKFENYQHFFAVFDLEMNLLRYSELFKLNNEQIENCKSFIIENNTIILCYSILNKYAKISKYSLDYINNNLMWYKNDEKNELLK
jgi:mannosyltransferase OCH1-like enzyme